jgi:putative flippase GtrA
MRTFIRSLGVGALATAADLLALLLLVEALDVSAPHANVPALAVGVLIQYFGNKHLAFGDRSRHHLRQGLAFLGVEVGTLALNALAFHLLVTHVAVPYGLARLVGSALVYVGFSYPLWRRVFALTPVTPSSS